MRRLLIVLCFFLFASPCFALHHHRTVHKVKVHKPVSALFHTAGSLLAQNAEVDRLGLERIKNRSMLQELISDGELVPLPNCTAIVSQVPPWRAYTRPGTVEALRSISEDYYAVAHRPIRVDSAVRPLDVQKRLRRWNRSAAPVTGPTASVHPAGIAFDLQRNGLSRAQRTWLEVHLWYLQQLGRVIVEEEKACFHIVVLSSEPSLQPSSSLSELPFPAGI